MNRTAGLAYFGISALITVIMPLALIATVLANKIGEQSIEHYGCLIIYVSCFLSMGWIPVAFIATCLLCRPKEKITSRTNVAAMTAFGHCLFYGLICVFCWVSNSLVLNQVVLNHGVPETVNTDYIDYIDVAMMLFTVLYLIALAFANISQVRTLLRPLAPPSNRAG